MVKEIETGSRVRNNVRFSGLEIKYVQWYRLEGNWIKLDCGGVYKSPLPLHDARACSETPPKVK